MLEWGSRDGRGAGHVFGLAPDFRISCATSTEVPCHARNRIEGTCRTLSC